MIVTIALRTGPHGDHRVTKKDIDKNIKAIDRAIENKKKSFDDQLLLDTRSILEIIMEELPYA